ncbi:MAG: DUF1501 domain-containing protein [Planctomyces sp.]|nr:DUF1501 domain-containing protein [Planctomyces sp.]
MERGTLTRRGWLAASAGLAAGATSWLRRLAAATEGGPRPYRSCLLLWMAGGPSQTDTFDMKPGHDHGGPFQPIATSVPGLSVSEHLPKIAGWMDRLAVVRSMSTREGDHGRATDHLRTGYLPQGPIQFPVLGSLVSNEHGAQTGDLPHYVSILPRGLFRAGIPPAGFLGPDHAPLLVGNQGGEGSRLGVENLALPPGISSDQAQARRELLMQVQRPFLDQHPGSAASGYRTAIDRSTRLMSPAAREAFQLDQEEPGTLERYGASQFGQGCLLARRLVESGVPFVEVTLGGWDTHNDNFTAVEGLCGTLDSAWSALMQDLEERGLLESTLVVWMGEFGRTPVINPQLGRDHYPRAWSVVLGGAGIRGGGVLGRTSDDGLTVEDRPVAVPDLLATICTALGLDPQKQNLSNVARPIRLVDPSGVPIEELLA